MLYSIKAKIGKGTEFIYVVGVMNYPFYKPNLTVKNWKIKIIIIMYMLSWKI